MTAPASDPAPELLVPGRRCPACSSELNVRLTPQLYELLRFAPPDALIATVQCRYYERGVCGTRVELRVEDVLRARPEYQC